MMDISVLRGLKIMILARLASYAEDEEDLDTSSIDDAIEEIGALRADMVSLVSEREEARQVARTFIVHANSSCDECAAAADIVDAWPLPGVAL